MVIRYFENHEQRLINQAQEIQQLQATLFKVRGAI